MQLEHDPQLEDLLEVPLRDIGDKGSPSREMGHQSLRLHPFERLAHRRTAQAQRLADLHLRNRGPEWEFPR